MEIIMKFTFKNKKEIQNLYLHDSLFKGFTYDYEERKLSLSIMIPRSFIVRNSGS